MKKQWIDKEGILVKASTAVVAIMIVVTLLYSWYKDSHIYKIDDKEYLLEQMNESTPESIHISNPIWGEIDILDTDFTFRFYDFLLSLPSATEETIQTNEIGDISGTVNLINGQQINFQLGEYVLIDGKLHGNLQSEEDLSFYSQKLKTYFYHKESIANMITGTSRVQVRRAQKKRNLGMLQKHDLKNLLMNAQEETVISDGPVIENFAGEVEITVEETSKFPELYLTFYEDGIAIVHDSSENEMGSILKLQVDRDKLKAFLGEFK